MRNYSHTEYWKELKLRFYYSAFSFFLSSVASYEERDLLFYFILKPLKDNTFEADKASSSGILFLQITEAFQAQLYLSILAGLLISLPVFWLQIWFFLAPALYKQEQNFFIFLIVSSLSFLGFGIFFAKNLLIPQAWTFFLSFSSFTNKETFSLIEDFEYLPSLIPYLQLSFEIFSAILVSSQLPLFFFLAVHWKWVNEDFLVRKRSLFIVIFLVSGALLSPPDLMSQILVFIPLFISYEFLILFLFCRSASRKQLLQIF